MNYTFIITSKEIWMEKNGYKYFMILRTRNYEISWYFGKPFFKKYQMIFEYDNKQIGLYTKIIEENTDNNDNSNKSILVYILVII